MEIVSTFANAPGAIGPYSQAMILNGLSIKEASEFVSQKIKERIDPLPEVFMELHKLENDKEILRLKSGGRRNSILL